MAISFDNRVTMGNVLTITAMIVGLSMGYAALQGQQKAQERRIDQIEVAHRDRLSEGNSRSLAVDARLRSLEVAQASQSSDLRAIQAGINEIKQALDRLAPRP